MDIPKRPEGWEHARLGTPGADGIQWILTDDWGLAPFLLIAISLWVQATWCMNRTETSEMENHWSGGFVQWFVQWLCDTCRPIACLGPIAMTTVSHQEWTSSLPLWLEAALQILAASEQFYPFPHPWEKNYKINSFGYLKPQLRAVSHSEKPARVTAVLLQAVAFQGWDSSDIRQKELQKHTTSESKWHPVQSL